MKVNSNAKLELSVSCDKHRAVLNNVFLDTKNQCLVATDGKQMAIVPCLVEEGDEDGFISPDALKQARKLARGSEDCTIGCNGSLALTNGAQLPRPKTDDFGTFPNYRQVLPKPDAPIKQTIAFDAQLLWELCQAMGGNTSIVTLKIESEMVSIRVSKSSAPSAQGVLMPCRVS